MDATEYQEFTSQTAIYPHSGTGRSEAILYCLLGLSGETGEICEKVKKVIRGGGEPSDLAGDPAIGKELSDVLWYLARLSKEFGFTLQEVIEANVEKLASRKARGVIQGEGDDR